MRIAAYVSADSHARLHRAVWSGHALQVAKSPDALAALAANGDCQLIVLDPTGIRDDVFHTVLDAVVESGVALVMWAPLSPSTIVRILQASAVVPTLALLHGIDDDAVGLQTAIRLGGATTAAAILLHRLSGRLNHLPESIRAACTAILCGVAIPASVAAFATETGWDSRTVQRHFLEASLGTPGGYLKVVRLARTWEMLHSPAPSLSDVATACCFVSEKALSAQFVQCVGLPPRRAIRRLTQESFVESLLSSMTPA